MKARIVDILQETPAVRRFILCVDEVKHFDFLPGQFVTVYFPQLPNGQNERSYSIASAPDGGNTFELCIVLNPQGAATPIFWQMQPGDSLEISEAKGSFVLPQSNGLDIAFICTGTGVAPFRSMLLNLLKTQKTTQKLYLIFGNRFAADILYRKEFEQLALEYPNFKFIPVLSRDPEWQGEKGYVHPVYENIFADKRDARFLVCGWNAMCIEARHRLKALGYNRRQYLFEEYG